MVKNTMPILNGLIIEFIVLNWSGRFTKIFAGIELSKLRELKEFNLEDPRVQKILKNVMEMIFL